MRYPLRHRAVGQPRRLRRLFPPRSARPRPAPRSGPPPPPGPELGAEKRPRQRLPRSAAGASERRGGAGWDYSSRRAARSDPPRPAPPLPSPYRSGGRALLPAPRSRPRSRRRCRWPGRTVTRWSPVRARPAPFSLLAASPLARRGSRCGCGCGDRRGFGRCPRRPVGGGAAPTGGSGPVSGRARRGGDCGSGRRERVAGAGGRVPVPPRAGENRGGSAGMEAPPRRGLRRRPGAPGSAADARCPPALRSPVPAVRPPRRCPSRPPPYAEPPGWAPRSRARWAWRWARGSARLGGGRPRCRRPAVCGGDGSGWRAPARACPPRCGRRNASLPTQRAPPSRFTACVRCWRCKGEPGAWLECGGLMVSLLSCTKKFSG